VIGSGAAEERKRGQRLFGALLGTLSQTSAKPAHRRRDEIEKRQQDKLRQKDEELADEKRKKRQELDALRRKEQQLWDKQGVSIEIGRSTQRELNPLADHDKAPEHASHSTFS
jgi:pinin/SDK/memA/ protein conserved region